MLRLFRVFFFFKFCTFSFNFLQVVAAHRSAFYHAQGLRVAGDLGQVVFSRFHLENDESIRRAVQYSDVVINCVGKDCDTMNTCLEKVHVIGARKIAKICREMGVKKLIHVSALNASPNPRVLNVLSIFSPLISLICPRDLQIFRIFFLNIVQIFLQSKFLVYLFHISNL